MDNCLLGRSQLVRSAERQNTQADRLLPAARVDFHYNDVKPPHHAAALVAVPVVAEGNQCQDEPDYRAVNREKHPSDEPVARRQPQPISSRAGARATKYIGRVTLENSYVTLLTVKLKS